ncbi:hypothetical protein PILCRDRAFT_817962 [Piloderma croceum F 1598]|uniref:Uncharacterized protein n=1 Tax=Piloderma croceum (strain F 1598) TaxID=765440 RepID=A0A0C3G3H1_PILCF|nr:hypothetical protein PILCRDRAFT_817962 [Piloderma croceum F 1598]
MFFYVVRMRHLRKFSRTSTCHLLIRPAAAIGKSTLLHQTSSTLFISFHEGVADLVEFGAAIQRLSLILIFPSFEFLTLLVPQNVMSRWYETKDKLSVGVRMTF